MTPEEYAAEVAAARQELPNTRFVVYDHEIIRDRAWFRFTPMWTDPSTGETRTRAGMQVYRVEEGKLAETWLMLHKLGSAWPNALGGTLDEQACLTKLYRGLAFVKLYWGTEVSR